MVGYETWARTPVAGDGVMLFWRAERASSSSLTWIANKQQFQYDVPGKTDEKRLLAHGCCHVDLSRRSLQDPRTALVSSPKHSARLQIVEEKRSRFSLDRLLHNTKGNGPNWSAG